MLITLFAYFLHKIEKNNSLEQKSSSNDLYVYGWKLKTISRARNASKNDFKTYIIKKKADHKYCQSYFYCYFYCYFISASCYYLIIKKQQLD